jgi:hypothetical protein
MTYTALPMETMYPGGTPPPDFVMAICRAAAVDWQQVSGISGAGAAGAGELASLTVGGISETYASGGTNGGGSSAWQSMPGLKQSLAPYVRGASRARTSW